ncbi:MAG: hypothetical protein HY021_12725 [Burkholderiales bacterium]|nr:hypothetical protein [Burkholderiales bacterium]
MKIKLFASLSAVALLLAAGAAVAGPKAYVVEGQKLDSGLGELPHYAKWSDASGRNVQPTRVLGESLDDGLGQLPHYSKWKDRTGKDPMGQDAQRVTSSAKR